MLRYLLDTNICIDVIKRRPQELLDTFKRHGAQMAISAITFSELLHGVEKGIWISEPWRLAI
jgi:tRNA(fMet)-specific endonuclease VapC